MTTGPKFFFSYIYFINAQPPQTGVETQKMEQTYLELDHLSQNMGNKFSMRVVADYCNSTQSYPCSLYGYCRNMQGESNPVMCSPNFVAWSTCNYEKSNHSLCGNYFEYCKQRRNFKHSFFT